MIPFVIIVQAAVLFSSIAALMVLILVDNTWPKTKLITNRTPIYVTLLFTVQVTVISITWVRELQPAYEAISVPYYQQDKEFDV